MDGNKDPGDRSSLLTILTHRDAAFRHGLTKDFLLAPRLIQDVLTHDILTSRSLNLTSNISYLTEGCSLRLQCALDTSSTTLVGC